MKNLLFKKVVIVWAGLLIFGGLSVVNWSSQDSQQSMSESNATFKSLERYGTLVKTYNIDMWAGAVNAATDDCNEQTHYVRMDWCDCVGVVIANYLTIEDIDQFRKTGKPSVRGVRLASAAQAPCSNLYPRHWLASGNGWLGINWFRVLLVGLGVFAIGFDWPPLSGPGGMLVQGWRLR